MKPHRLLPALCLVLVACFEQPIKENLALRFLENGAVLVHATVELADAESVSNAAVKRRLEQARRDLLDGTDAWAPRFAALAPAAERYGWEKRLGEVKRLERSAALAEPASLSELFRDTSLSVTYRVVEEERWAELAIVPGASSRATRRQRKELDEALGPWCERVAAYLEAARNLYDYLDDHPDRARACLADLFSDLAEEEKPALTEEEEALLEPLGKNMEEVLGVLLVDGDAAYSLDEISHLVYDPFPARLSVTLPGKPLEVEGFATAPDGALTVSGLGLWDALASLEGRWLSPDLVQIYVAHQSGGKQALDLDSLAEAPRRSDLHVQAKEVEQAIAERLTPAPLYRARWRIDPRSEPALEWPR